MRLLYVVHGFPPDTWAGTEVHTFELALEMQRRGHQVSVLARAPAGGAPDWSLREDEFGGLRVLRIARRTEGLPLGESYRPAAARAPFVELLARERPELVHFQHLLHLSVDWIEIARERGLATVWTANDYWALCARVQLQRTDGVRCDGNRGMGCFPCIKDKPPWLVPVARTCFPALHPLVRLLDGRARPGGRLSRFTHSWIDLAERQAHVLARFASADLVIAPSRFLRAKLLASRRFDPRRVIHSDYGMRAEQPLEKLPAADGRTRLGYIGSLVEHKGIGVLVDAMRRLRGRPLCLAVFGDFDPARDAFHTRLADRARGASVTFHGRFDNARLAEVYREIDALVVPSTWFENSPLTIHEAFLQRTPVVTSNIGGMAELVRDGVDGLHFAVGDERELARTLSRLVDEPGLLQALARGLPTCKSVAEDARDLEGRYAALLGR